jgi:hypothetical protein
MLPEKYKAWDKIEVTVPIQDSIYQNWNGKIVETIKNLPLRKGVIICKDAITNKGKKSDDLYLAFSLNADFIRLEEVNGTHNKTSAVWEVPYEGQVDFGSKLYNLKYEMKYGIQRKRMHLLTSTFFGIMEYVSLNLLDGESISVHPENVKVVKQQKKGDPVISYVDCETYVIDKVTPIEGKPRFGQSGNIVWLVAPSTQTV